jgi:hypothetical protein
MLFTADRPLSEFLSRNPWSSRRLLEQVFSEVGFGIALEKERTSIRQVDLPLLGTFYACQEEPLGSIAHAHRLNLVRQYILARFGPDVFTVCLSLTETADCEFLAGDIWYRVWGDMGGISVEALTFIRQPPIRYAEQVVDLVVTCDVSRVDAIRLQLERNWSGGVVLVESSDLSRRVSVKLHGTLDADRRWIPYFSQDLDRMIQARMGHAYPSEVYDAAAALSPQDWQLLFALGNNPLLTPVEFANAVGWDEYLGPVVRTTEKYYQIPSPSAVLERLRVMKNFSLTAAYDDGTNTERLYLTWKAMALLMVYWNATSENLQRFHPWPQRADEVGRLAYSTHWLVKMIRHQTLCRQFVLSLIFGGRTTSAGAGGVDVRSETMVGGRIIYETPDSKVVWFTPDAIARASLFTAVPGSKAPRLLQQMILLIEIDRATNPLTRLDDKFERYLGVWRSLASQNPQLIWVIDGTPTREKYILEQMQKYHITGWTVLLDRLHIDVKNQWWDDYPTYLDFPFFLSATGCLAPYRKVWYSTDAPTTLAYLFGASPWSKISMTTVNSLNSLLDRYRIGN